jgi:gentisate 1,2-dioxygenase
MREAAGVHPRHEFQQLLADLRRHHMTVHQPGDPPLMTREPVTTVRACVWRWTDIEALAKRVAEAVPLEPEGNRRTIRLVNPGLPNGTTHTLWAAIQQVLPGEIATAHRHTPGALRFVIEGCGATTTVEGERYPMEVGDLLLTPSWTWHDHTNTGTERMIWLDGLDIPLVRAMHAVFFEPHPRPIQPVAEWPDHSMRSFGAGTLRPLQARASSRVSPLLVYKWARSYEALQTFAATKADLFDDVALEYQNPLTGGPALPTIGLAIQMLRPSVHTQAHRHVSSTVYHVVRGEGSTIVEGERLAWSERDFLVVPSWTWHEHANASASEPAILFQMNDAPAMEALGLYRHEAYGANGGRQ